MNAFGWGGPVRCPPALAHYAPDAAAAEAFLEQAEDLTAPDTDQSQPLAAKELDSHVRHTTRRDCFRLISSASG
jgi:hypothetical protein